MKTLIILSSVLFLTGCFDSDAQEKEQEKAAAKETVKISQPFFSENTKLKKSANLGQSVFDKNCIACHGQAGEGLTKDWKKGMQMENSQLLLLMAQRMLGIIRQRH